MKFVFKYRFVIYFATFILLGFWLRKIYLSELVFDRSSTSNSSVESTSKLIKELQFHSARIDSRSIVNIYDWVWSGEKWESAQNSLTVCLSTQGSMDRLHWIYELVQHWNGPLSLAVFVTSPKEWIGLNLVVHHFKKCSKPFRDFVSIHVAIPTEIGNWTSKWEELQLSSDNDDFEHFVSNFTSTSCQIVPKQVVVSVNEMFTANETLMINYPQNILRNIAKNACGLGYVFPTDIDIIPRPNSASLLSNFVSTEEAQSCEKCAFVIPTFELRETLPYPESKMHLLQFWKAKNATPFHFNIYKEGHNATDYSRWAATELDEGPVKISHDALKNRMQTYEPFAVSLNTIPEYPEIFVGYGFTRNSQVQAALSEGWQFKVLTPIFTIHWGMQYFNNLISPANNRRLRTEQTFRNSKIFTRFKKELDFRSKLKKMDEKKELKLVSSTSTTETNKTGKP